MINPTIFSPRITSHGKCPQSFLRKENSIFNGKIFAEKSPRKWETFLFFPGSKLLCTTQIRIAALLRNGGGRIFFFGSADEAHFSLQIEYTKYSQIMNIIQNVIKNIFSRKNGFEEIFELPRYTIRRGNGRKRPREKLGNRMPGSLASGGCAMKASRDTQKY